MGWASTMVSPPDGDISDFMASCEKLIGRDEKTFLPGHGDKIDAPLQRIQELIDHRKHRESQIINALGSGPASISELTQKIYHDTPKSLHGAAQRNVLAHLIDLTFRGLTTSNNGFSNIAEFKLK